MSAPSVTHERVRDDLNTLALLAGYGVPLVFPVSLIPDVARIDPRRLRVFVGDAKHTETPNNYETRRRLAQYVGHIARWIHADFGVTLAIAYDDETSRWQPTVETLFADSGLLVADSGSEVFSLGFVVAWATTRSRMDSQGGRY
jgi:hypothetical protein